MKSMANVSLRFGVLNLPIQVCKATESSDISFSMAGPDGEKLRQAYLDQNGNEVPREDTLRCYEGKTFTQEQVSDINAACKVENLEINEFVSLKEIPFQRVTGAYYIRSHRKDGYHKGFNTLVTALRKLKVGAVCKWTPRSRQQLLVIYPDPNSKAVLAISLSFAGDWREPDADALVHEDAKVVKAEVDLACEIIKGRIGGDFLDTAEDEALELKRNLINSGETPELPEKPDHPKAPDLMEQLKASIAEEEKAAA